MAEAIIFRTGVKLPDGDHLLPCGATITVKGGVPVKLVTPLAHFDHSLAMTEAETFAGLWLYFDDDDDADEEPGGAWIVVVGEVQPTHRFHGDAQGPREVRLSGRFLCALDRAAHQEGEDALGWPPFLDGETWRDGWTGRPIPGARAEPLNTEPQAGTLRSAPR